MTGTVDGATDLGTFPGVTISDNTDLRTALTELETKAETASLMNFLGSWDASTNTPTLVASTGTQGDVYRVSVAGSTDLDGETNWGVGDWAYFTGATWQRADNVDDVLSVAGKVGAVVLDTDDVTEAANLYYTEGRVDANANVVANTAKISAAGSIDTHSDVDVSTVAPTDGQVMTYVNANSKWEPKASAGGGGGGGSAAKLIGGGAVSWNLGGKELFTGGSPNGGNAISTDTEWDAQSFSIPTTAKIKSMDINLINTASGTGTAQIDIHADTAGEPGAVLFSGGGVDLSTIPNVNALYNFPIEAELTGGVTYWLVIRSTGTGGTWNTLVKLDHIASGNRAVTLDSGANWTDLPAEDLEFDIYYADVCDFDNSLFLEVVGLDYSANTIPTTESSFTLNADKRVAYVTPNDTNPGGNLTVSVGDLTDVADGDIVIARRDGDHLLIGDTLQVNDGESRGLYDTTSGLIQEPGNTFNAVIDAVASASYAPESEGAPFIDHVEKLSDGNYKVHYIAGTFTEAPSVLATPLSPVPTDVQLEVISRDITDCTIRQTNSTASAFTNNPFCIFVGKQGADYNAGNVLDNTKLHAQTISAFTNSVTPTGTLTGAASKAIFGTVTSDESGMYNTTTGILTAPRSGKLNVSVFLPMTYTSETGITVTARAKNTTTGAEVRDQKFVNDAITQQFSRATGILEVNEGDLIEIQGTCNAAAGRAFAGNASFSFDYIPDFSIYGAALTQKKTSTHFLTADINGATTGNSSDLQFNNLVIGQSYNLKTFLFGAFSTEDSNIEMKPTHDGVVIARNKIMANGPSASGMGGNSAGSTSSVNFVATATTVTFFYSITRASVDIFGNSTLEETHAVLTEIEPLTETNDWD